MMTSCSACNNENNIQEEEGDNNNQEGEETDHKKPRGSENAGRVIFQNQNNFGTLVALDKAETFLLN